MGVPVILTLAFLLQQPAPLDLGTSKEGTVSDDASVVRTPTLDTSYTNAPTLGLPFQISILKSGPYFIELKSYDFDAYLTILGADGNLLAEDDDGLIGTHSRLAVHLEESQQYQVFACALHGARGEFQIELHEGVPPQLSPEEVNAITVSDLRGRIAQRKENFGRESVEYGAAVYDLALHYYYQREFQKARPILKSVIEIYGLI